MNDFDPTRLSDYALAELYFDTLAQSDSDNEKVETMRDELEGRDLLFEGYHICDWLAAPSFTVVGCKQIFKTLEQLKDYITACKGIEPTVDGDMHYL